MVFRIDEKRPLLIFSLNRERKVVIFAPFPYTFKKIITSFIK